MFGDSRLAAALVLACATGACARHTAPSGYLPTPAEIPREAFGAWVDLTFRYQGAPREARGELIAASADTLWLLDGGRAHAVATDSVTAGRLVSYDARPDQVAGATILGTIATISNGLLLILTAPLWLLTGSIAAHSQSRLPIEDLPPPEWADLARFARFPQGIPDGVDLSALEPHPVLRGRR